jgi:ElaA protein
MVNLLFRFFYPAYCIHFFIFNSTFFISYNMITWTHKHFNDLTPPELYAILQLRNAVFVVEQNCVFQDADNKDQRSYHIMGWKDGYLAAYSRLVPPGISYTEASIGRVVTASAARGSGIGKILMKYSIEMLYNIWSKQEIKIGAQLYLQNFYQSFGFQQTSEIYLEDGINHIEMVLTTST